MSTQKNWTWGEVDKAGTKEEMERAIANAIVNDIDNGRQPHTVIGPKGKHYGYMIEVTLFPRSTK